MAQEKKSKSGLVEFLNLFEQIPELFIGSLLEYSGDEDERNIINSFAPTLKNQFKQLSVYITEQSGRASLQNQKEVETFLKVSSGVSLVNGFKSALPSINSLIGKLGIDGIIKEIKKIIEEILDLFGISLPKWIKKLLLIIDQIIKTLLGGSSMKTINMLSQLEQNYLAELRGLALLRSVSDNSGAFNEEED